MADINKVILVGRLTKNALLRYTQSGDALSNFALAVNRKVKNGDCWKDEASFFDIVLLGKQAEALNQYLQKGKQVAIEGYLKQERWQKDGINYSRVVIVAQSIQLLGGNKPQERCQLQNQNTPSDYAQQELVNTSREDLDNILF